MYSLLTVNHLQNSIQVLSKISQTFADDAVQTVQTSLRCNAASRTCRTTLLCRIVSRPSKWTFSWGMRKSLEDEISREGKTDSKQLHFPFLSPWTWLMFKVEKMNQLHIPLIVSLFSMSWRPALALRNARYGNRVEIESGARSRSHCYNIFKFFFAWMMVRRPPGLPDRLRRPCVVALSLLPGLPFLMSVIHNPFEIITLQCVWITRRPAHRPAH